MWDFGKNHPWSVSLIKSKFTWLASSGTFSVGLTAPMEDVLKFPLSQPLRQRNSQSFRHRRRGSTKDNEAITLPSWNTVSFRINHHFIIHIEFFRYMVNWKSVKSYLTRLTLLSMEKPRRYGQRLPHGF